MGACLYPHEFSHPYRVVEHVSRPVFSTDWSADEELRLLEGLEMYGPGNFHTVAEYVGTKSKIKCEQHYLEVYLDAVDTAPLPNPERMTVDMKVVMSAIPLGTPRSAVVAREMALTAAAAANLNPALARLAQTRSKVSHSGGTDTETADTISKPSSDEYSVQITSGHDVVTASPQSPTAQPGKWLSEQKAPLSGKSFGDSSTDKRSEASPILTAAKATTSTALAEEDVQSIRVSPSGRPRKGDIAGYMPKRQDYDVEPYQNDAESLIADMYITEEDTAEERELKLRILEIYSLWLDERARCKAIVEERGFTDLAGTRTREKSKTHLERRLGRILLPFAQMTPGRSTQHDEFLKRMATEVQLIEEIREIWEALRSGVETLADFEHWRRERILREQKSSVPLTIDWVEPPARREGPSGQASSGMNESTTGTVLPRRPRGRPKRIRPDEMPSITIVPSAGGVSWPDSPLRERGRSRSTAMTTATQALSIRMLQNESAAQVQHWPSIVQRRQVAQPQGAQRQPSAMNPPTQNLLYIENWPSAKLLNPLEKELCALLRLVPDRFLEIRSLIATQWSARMNTDGENASEDQINGATRSHVMTLDLRPDTEIPASAEQQPSEGVSSPLRYEPPQTLLNSVAAEFLSSNDEDRSSPPRRDRANTNHSESASRGSQPGRRRGRYRPRQVHR